MGSEATAAGGGAKGGERVAATRRLASMTCHAMTEPLLQQDARFRHRQIHNSRQGSVLRHLLAHKSAALRHVVMLHGVRGRHLRLRRDRLRSAVPSGAGAPDGLHNVFVGGVRRFCNRAYFAAARHLLHFCKYFSIFFRELIK